MTCAGTGLAVATGGVHGPRERRSAICASLDGVGESDDAGAGSRAASPEELTGFLNDLAHGRVEAGATLMPYVYAELRAIAEGYLQRRADRALQPTELISEAFLRLLRSDGVSWNDRRHFFALAAKAMRQLLIDEARRRGRLKRGEGRRAVTLDEAFVGTDGPPMDLLDLDQALEELSGLDPRQGRVVELRFFGGLDVDQVAETLEVSKSTVEREWRSARAWLGHRLAGSF